VLALASGAAQAAKPTPKPSPTPTPTPAPTNFGLVFMDQVNDGQLALFEFKADGSQKTRITRDWSLTYQHPARSPDGSRIAFYSPHRNAEPYGAFFSIKPDGTDTRMHCPLPLR
jgi:Tol biopolymer transport system component